MIPSSNPLNLKPCPTRHCAASLKNSPPNITPKRHCQREEQCPQCCVRIADGDTSTMERSSDTDLNQFLEGLSMAWQQGEIRPTHRAKSKPSRYWRTREDPFVEVWSKVCIWLENEPDRTAKELFQRLQDEHPGEFSDGQIRTLQRRIKKWRANAARVLVFGDSFETNDCINAIKLGNEPIEMN